MIDINTILTQALTAVVQEATKPLLARIEALETKPAIGVDTTATPATITADAFVTHLDNQEWFWEKIRNFADAAALAALDDHCGTYDHDSYDNAVSSFEDIDVDDFMRKDDSLEDAIRDTVRGMSFEIR